MDRYYCVLTQATAIATESKIKAIDANASAFESFSLLGLLIGVNSWVKLF